MAGDGERRCRRCGDGELREETETLSVELPRSAVTASVSVPVRRCAACDDVQLDASLRERFRLATCCELADAGVDTGEALRHMRKALGLRAAELARLLDLTPETISHWETGRAAPNRAAFIAVCAMVQDALDGRTTTRDRLARLASPEDYPHALAVKLR
ncbi:type II TA system antitoxin MqsA family protein [Anaeromyxobacter terrae]|uniref:type II TA system antitoxin MqsA family protein n=1 Tax=Anaeromyxobacter terrae TaxID=2925406 RepID=UPI001F58A801|nr:type II TA system antitoxin MqsA family protein [Anaeromyxobacter sp. SG22]